MKNKPRAEKSLVMSGLGDACIHPRSNLPGLGHTAPAAGGPRLLGDGGRMETKDLLLEPRMDCSTEHPDPYAQDTEERGWLGEVGSGRSKQAQRRMCTCILPYTPMHTGAYTSSPSLITPAQPGLQEKTLAGDVSLCRPLSPAPFPLTSSLDSSS